MLVVDPMPVVRRLAGNAPALMMTKSGVPKLASSSLRRANQHGVHEKRVIWPRTNHPHLDPILRVPTGETIEAIKPLAGIEVIQRALAIDRKSARRTGY